MSCGALERWLDDGRPQAGAEAMRAHAAGCPRCAALLRAAESVERLLAEPGPAVAAPPAFAAEVMRRVREVRAARAAAQLLALPPALAWWLRLAADPVVALGLILASLLAWRHEALWTFASWSAARIAALREVSLQLPGATSLTFTLPAALRLFTDPTVLLGLVMALVPALLWLSWQLYRWSGHAFAGPDSRRSR